MGQAQKRNYNKVGTVAQLTLGTLVIRGSKGYGCCATSDETLVKQPHLEGSSLSSGFQVSATVVEMQFVDMSGNEARRPALEHLVTNLIDVATIHMRCVHCTVNMRVPRDDIIRPDIQPDHRLHAKNYAMRLAWHGDHIGPAGRR